ncbi:AraC family transcriptional regulator [Phreatobacter stygius]|nr:AraC family transcriptional regulator [Phreatobacter stygius]
MDGPITQAQALGTLPLGQGEAARFFAASRFGGIDCLSATFVSHAYALHSHETYAIGSVLAGCEVWNARGRRHHAGPGDLVFNHPLDVHDGAPLDGGYSYRMTYPGLDFIRLVAGSIAGRVVTETPFFPEPVVRDPEGARLFTAAHAALEENHDGLAGEELLLRAFGRMLVLHAGLGEAAIGREAGPVARVRSLIEARYGEDLRLDDLAATAGLSTHHLIRAFRREIGLTPHAYVIDVRVRRAQDSLKSGSALAETAAAVGFADQAHLTRAFKARLGVTPGAYRRAVAG